MQINASKTYLDITISRVNKLSCIIKSYIVWGAWLTGAVDGRLIPQLVSQGR